MNPVLITICVYIFIIYVIGGIASRKTKKFSDFVLASRKLSGPVAAIGAGASDMSGAWLMMALPGAFMLGGLNVLWLPVGLTIGAFLNWQFVAKRLRVYTQLANESLTIPSYFENRFHDTSKILRVVTALVIIIFFTFYTAAGFVSGALLTKTTFGIDYTTALYVSALVMIVYTVIGGFIAVNWIDFFQGALMFISLIIVPFVALTDLGGLESMIQKTNAINPDYFNVLANTSTISIVSLLAWGLGYFGQPHILARFMAIKNKDDVPMARFICMTWMILALYGAILTGFSGIAYFSEHPLADADTIFITYSSILFNPWLTGFMIAAVLSAIMSTVTAQLLVSSSALTEDFYHALFRKKASQKELVLISRVAVIVIALVAVMLATNQKSTILQLVGFAWSGTGACFGPIILFSLFWPRMTRMSAIWGMSLSALTVFVWHFLGEYLGGIFLLYDLLPAFIVNCVTILLVSLFGQTPDDKILNEFSKMKRLSS